MGPVQVLRVYHVLEPLAKIRLTGPRKASGSSRGATGLFHLGGREHVAGLPDIVLGRGGKRACHVEDMVRELSAALPVPSKAGSHRRGPPHSNIVNSDNLLRNSRAPRGISLVEFLVFF